VSVSPLAVTILLEPIPSVSNAGVPAHATSSPDGMVACGLDPEISVMGLIPVSLYADTAKKYCWPGTGFA